MWRINWMYSDNAILLCSMVIRDSNNEVQHMIKNYSNDPETNFFTIPILTNQKSCNITNRMMATYDRFHSSIDITKYGIKKIIIKDGYWGEEKLGYDALYYMINGDIIPMEYKNGMTDTDKIVGNRYGKVPFILNSKYKVNRKGEISHFTFATFSTDEMDIDSVQSKDRNNLRIRKEDIDKIFLISGSITTNEKFVVWE